MFHKNIVTCSGKTKTYGVDVFNHKIPFLLPLCCWIGGILCSGINFPDFYLWSCYLLCGLLFIFPHTRKPASLLLFPCLFLCSAGISRPTPVYLPANPVYFHCRYEEKLSHNSHIVSADRHSFCLESSRTFSLGDSLQFEARFSRILLRNRSGLFNYNRYLQQKGVYARVQAIDSIRVSGHAHTPRYYLSRLRNKLIPKADRIFEDTLSSALIKALCIGYKEPLSSSTRELFAETGTMHLLAVSGLHTGAVWLLLTYLFRIAGLKGKKSHLFLLPVLWAYACITGLSPSVVRAAYILTFISLSHVLGRDYNAPNAIAASALFALIVNPHALYSVGMQMSYAAYSGIIGITPLLKKFISSFPRLSVPICVTLSAQLATFPLSAYYFHSISLNSFLVNLIAIPLTTLLLYAGIFALFLPSCIGCFLSYPIQLLCKALTCSLHVFNTINVRANHLYPTEIHILLLYGLLLSVCFYFRSRRKPCLLLVSLLTATLCGYSCLHNHLLRKKKEIVIFHSYSHSCILLNIEGSGLLLKNTLHPLTEERLTPYIQNHKLQLMPAVHGFLHSQIYYDGKQLRFPDDTIHIIDQSNIRAEGGIWIVTHDVYPKHLLTSGTPLPRLIILDASCRPHCIRQWENTCHHLRIPLRTTRQEGDIHLPLHFKKRRNKM